MLKRVAIAAVAALMAVPVAASARVIQAESVLPPGQSGHVPQGFDFGGADGAAFRLLTDAGLERAAANAAAQLGGDPSTWRRPRRMYDVQVLGLAPKPALKAYDRGTWQLVVELGP